MSLFYKLFGIPYTPAEFAESYREMDRKPGEFATKFARMDGQANRRYEVYIAQSVKPASALIRHLTDISFTCKSEIVVTDGKRSFIYQKEKQVVMEGLNRFLEADYEIQHKNAQNLVTQLNKRRISATMRESVPIREDIREEALQPA